MFQLIIIDKSMPHESLDGSVIYLKPICSISLKPDLLIAALCVLFLFFLFFFSLVFYLITGRQQLRSLPTEMRRACCPVQTSQTAVTNIYGKTPEERRRIKHDGSTIRHYQNN